MSDDTALDPAASVALIAEQRAKVQAATDVDGRLLFGVWGVAWLIGFWLQWAAWGDDPLIHLSYGAALAVFGMLLITAMVVTTVHIARRSAGIRGTTSTQGAMYGWAWFFAFAGIGVLGHALDSAGASAEVVSMAMTASSTLLVGVLYMAGGALWRVRIQFVLGAWICLVTIVATLVGTPNMLLVMALAGGGGMLVAGVVEAVRRGRRLGR